MLNFFVGLTLIQVMIGHGFNSYPYHRKYNYNYDYSWIYGEKSIFTSWIFTIKLPEKTVYKDAVSLPIIELKQ